MSKEVVKHKHFLELLLNTHDYQARALLDTVSNDQVDVISEIAFNLNDIKHSDSVQQGMRFQKHLLKKLANRNVSNNKKKIIIRHNRKQLLKVLKLFRRDLLSLISEKK